MPILSETLCNRRWLIRSGASVVGWYVTRLGPVWAQRSPTPDTQALQSALSSGNGKILTIDRSYRVAAPDNHFFSDTQSDPQSAAVTIRSNMTIDGKGIGAIIGTTPDKSVIQVYDGPRPVNRVVIRNVRLQQPDSLILGDGRNHGLTDDYFALRFNGVSDCEATNIVIETCSLGVTFQFNQYAKPTDAASRASRNNRSSNIRIKRCTYLGLQLAGESFGSHTDYTMHGESKAGGGLAATHGIRLIGAVNSYIRAVCEKNEVTGHVIDGFSNALSMQQWCRNNTVSITSRGCKNGVNVSRSLPHSRYGEPVDTTAQQNSVTIKHEGGAYGIYSDGGSHNTFDVQITGTSICGINERPSMGTPGLSTGNTYRGSISDPGKRGAQLAGDDTTIDLDIAGSGQPATDAGCLIMGDSVKGRVAVRGCKAGVMVSGGNANLAVKIMQCRMALVITGDGNTLACDIDGDVMISGNHNRLTGRIRGRVTVAPQTVGNDVSVGAT